MQTQRKKTIVSLLPAATEMVCALGCEDQLLGISHECDYPEAVQTIDVLSSVKINHQGKSETIHRDVLNTVQSALSIYTIDLEKILQLQPDVILTQDLCGVCGVSSHDLKHALDQMTQKNVELLSFSPKTLKDVEENLLQLGKILNQSQVAKAYCDAWNAKFYHLKKSCLSRNYTIKVLALEWLQPVMIGGLWMQELMTMANVDMLGPGKGEKAQTVDQRFLKSIQPDVVIVKPCGFSIKQSLQELDLIKHKIIQRAWNAYKNNAIFVADGHHYFNRPGPRLFDSAELIAQLCSYAFEQTLPDEKFNGFWQQVN